MFDPRALVQVIRQHAQPLVDELRTDLEARLQQQLASVQSYLQGQISLIPPATFAQITAVLAAASTAISVNGQQITNLGTPMTSTAAATKGYVDTAVSGAGGFQAGTLILAGGTCTVSTGITITSKTTTRIFFSQNVPQPPLAPGGYWANPTNYTLGGPGTGAFTVQALNLDGTEDMADGSHLNYLIVG